MKEEESVHNLVGKFLLKNGFTKSSENTYTNDKCDVGLHFDDEIYEIYIIKDDASMFSTDLNIYWLIGCLTYNELMNKDYII